MARRDTTALIKRLKKRLNEAKRKAPLEKLPEVLEEEALGILPVEAELEFEAEEVNA
ncbi:MAG: hypothetical protein J7K48_08075 [Thermococcus sp.]|nr:hypothetical protein [Thermococcus sp.]